MRDEASEAPQGDERTFLIKNEDIRRDAIVMEMLRLMRLRLIRMRGPEFADVVVYDVLPTEIDAGVLRPVPNCKTLYEVKERERMSLLNYILDKNPEKRVDECRRRFVRTCAAYSAMTYILGIGDRHLDNILVTDDGSLFHIDYGFSFGDNPLLRSTDFRLTEEMVDALGGRNGALFAAFVDEFVAVHGVLRLAVHEYECIASQLSYTPEELARLAQPEVVMPRDAIGAMQERCLVASPDSLAAAQMEARIKSNAEHPWYLLIDFFHHHSKQESLKSLLGAVMGTLGGLFGSRGAE